MSLENIDPRILLVAGLALVVFVLLRASRNLLSRRLSTTNAVERTSEPKGARGRDSGLADAPPEVLRWQVEMHEMARDMKAEIDTKLVALQAVTRLAREERERLEAAIQLARPKT